MSTSVKYEEVNGKKIFSILQEPENSQKKIVIMSHGFRGSSLGPARTFVDFGRLLVENGYSILRFDQPNSGNSEGNYMDSSFNEWLNTTTHFVKGYLDMNYRVGLLGQSMGATTSAIATSKEELKDKIDFLLLWVPGVPDRTLTIESNKVYEEGGQKYKGVFWNEERSHDIFKCIENYKGGIHLVYGENDKFVRRELREKMLKLVESKSQKTMILAGQNHSPWEYDMAQKVYEEQLNFINNLWDL